MIDRWPSLHQTVHVDEFGTVTHGMPVRHQAANIRDEGGKRYEASAPGYHRTPRYAPNDTPGTFAEARSIDAVHRADRCDELTPACTRMSHGDLPAHRHCANHIKGTGAPRLLAVATAAA